jgi:hypothetical protein
MEQVEIRRDFNAHIGGGQDKPGVCGIFELRQSNEHEQGRKLVECCENNHVNSYYNYRRIGTWSHPRSNEIDGFLMRNNQRHKHEKKISIVGEVTISDHKPILMKFRLDVNPREKDKIKRIPRIKLEKLRLPEFVNQYKDRIGEIIEENVDNVNTDDDMKRWNELTDTVIKASEEVCGTEERKVDSP